MRVYTISLCAGCCFVSQSGINRTALQTAAAHVPVMCNTPLPPQFLNEAALKHPFAEQVVCVTENTQTSK